MRYLVDKGIIVARVQSLKTNSKKISMGNEKIIISTVKAGTRMWKTSEDFIKKKS